MSLMHVAVSDRAKQGLDHFVAQAVKSSLAPAGAACPVVQADDAAGPGSGRELVMLTVSSYMFRVLLFIHFDRSLVMRAHLASMGNVTVETMDNERFDDELMERGNLCCGALNRDLSIFFPHIGMSTPCLLKRSSVDHLGTVKPVLTRRYRAELGAGVEMHFTLAVCAFADLDFPFEPHAAVEEDTAGELEMF